MTKRDSAVLNPALGRCGEALNIIKDFIEGSGFIGKHLIGPKFDRNLKTSLKALSGAKELFMLALQADQQIVTVLHAVCQFLIIYSPGRSSSE